MSNATATLEQQADDARVRPAGRVATRALLQMVGDRMAQMLVRALLRGGDVALFHTDRDHVVTSADGGWYDHAPDAEKVIGTSLEKWAVWAAYERAFDYLRTHPRARMCSYTISLDDPVGTYFVVVVRHPEDGHGILCVEWGDGTNYLGDLSEMAQ